MTATAGGVRERILASAVDLFAQHGYDGTSVAQVISAAGVAKGGFYHHFASKEQLLYEVYGDLITRQFAGFEQIAARGLPPEQALREAIHDLIVTTAQSAKPALVFWREMNKLSDERTAEYRRQRRRYDTAMRQLISDGQRTGVFSRVASAQLVTYTIFGVVNELPLWYQPRGRMRPAQIATELADLVLAALRPVPPPAARAASKGAS